MDLFNFIAGKLHCEEVSVAKIAEEVGTPFYLYSANTLKRHISAFNNALSSLDHLVCFAVKANSNLQVLNIVGKQGAGADIVSGGELFRALKAGIPAEKIVYSGVGKTKPEISQALEAGILMFNMESLEEMEAICSMAANLGKKAQVSFRVNPDVDPKTHPYISTGLKKNKFGLPIVEALEAYKEAVQRNELEVVGISCHIGSQITELSPFVDALKRVLRVADALKKEGVGIKYIDIGGGVGIRYKDETPPTPEEYGKAIADILAGTDFTVIVEPGRAIAGNAGILVTRLIYTKETPEKTFYIVDAAMNDLARPSLYKAYHEIVAVEERDVPWKAVDVVGPICETGDFLARDRELPQMEPGDLLAVKSAGAYGFTMSSNYNSRPRPPEVVVSGNNFWIARKRETYEDLVRGETIREIA